MLSCNQVVSREWGCAACETGVLVFPAKAPVASVVRMCAAAGTTLRSLDVSATKLKAKDVLEAIAPCSRLEDLRTLARPSDIKDLEYMFRYSGRKERARWSGEQLAELHASVRFLSACVNMFTLQAEHARKFEYGSYLVPSGFRPKYTGERSDRSSRVKHRMETAQRLQEARSFIAMSTVRLDGGESSMDMSNAEKLTFASEGDSAALSGALARGEAPHLSSILILGSMERRQFRVRVRNVFIPPTVTSLSGQFIRDGDFGEHLGLQMTNVRTVKFVQCDRVFLEKFFAGRFDSLESLTISNVYPRDGENIGVCGTALRRLRNFSVSIGNTPGEDDVLGMCLIAKTSPLESVDFSFPINDSLCATLVAVVVASLPSGARAVFDGTEDITLVGARAVGAALKARKTPLRIEFGYCQNGIDEEISSCVVAGSGVEFSAEVEEKVE